MKTSQTCTPEGSCPRAVLCRFISLALHRLYSCQYNVYQTNETNMKITIVIARFLLGLIFLTFGLNGFLHFIPSSPPSGTAGQFVGALFVSHYLVPIFLLQIISAVLLLVNRYVPLALTLLAPIIVNILLIHILMLPSGLPLALVVTVLWIVVFLSVRSAFAGLWQPRVPAGGLR